MVLRCAKNATGGCFADARGPYNGLDAERVVCLTRNLFEHICSGIQWLAGVSLNSCVKPSIARSSTTNDTTAWRLLCCCSPRVSCFWAGGER